MSLTTPAVNCAMCSEFAISSAFVPIPKDQVTPAIDGCTEIFGSACFSGIRAAQAAGKVVGRPKRIFRRDEVVWLQDVEGPSLCAIGKKLGIPAMTALDSYRQSAPATCTDTASTGQSEKGAETLNRFIASRRTLILPFVRPSQRGVLSHHS